MKVDRIATPCPACGCRTVVIGEGGHLVCTWLKCPSPSLRETLEILKANTAVLKQLKATIDSAKVEG